LSSIILTNVARVGVTEGVDMDKPSWMNEIAPQDMTEAQYREYEAFEAKVKQLQDEQLKYRKQLEQELKKLKTEVVDLGTCSQAFALNFPSVDTSFNNVNGILKVAALMTNCFSYRN
jgi:hypothetical protein